MGSTERDRLKRMSKQAIAHGEKLLHFTSMMRNEYGETHPQYAELLDLINSQFVGVLDQLETFNNKFV